MTLEEKIGQLTQYTGGSTITGPTGEKLDFDAMLTKGEIGSLFNVTGAKETNHYQHIAVEQSRLHIPLLFGLDVIHGHRTTFPVPLALAASFDPDLVQQACRVAATEARQDGINWVFSPMVDISRDARWGRIVESAGEDPYLGSAIARAYIRGYQQGDLSKPDSVAASVKHFAAYGAAEAGRDYNTTDMSEIRLRQVYLPPYQAAVDEGAATVMSAFNALNGVPATANPFTLTKILRKEWGFDGMVVSDYGAVGELMKHWHRRRWRNRRGEGADRGRGHGHGEQPLSLTPGRAGGERQGADAGGGRGGAARAAGEVRDGTLRASVYATRTCRRMSPRRRSASWRRRPRKRASCC